MINLTSSEKRWLLVLLFVLLGVLSKTVFLYIKKEHDSLFTNQANQIKKPISPLGQQER